MNAHMERAESAGVVDDAFVLPSTPVRAADVVGAVVLPVRHRRARFSPRGEARVWMTVFLALVVVEAVMLGYLLHLVFGGAL